MALPQSQGSDSRAIFIGGVPRSGTTLMVRLLDRHPQVAAFGETQLVHWRVFREFPLWLMQGPQEERDGLIAAFRALCTTRFHLHRVGHQVSPSALALWKFLDSVWYTRFYRFRGAWTHCPALRLAESLWLSQPLQARTFGRAVPEGAEAREAFGMRGLYAFVSEEDVSSCFCHLDAMATASSAETMYTAYGEFWGAVFRVYARRCGKEQWAEKTPANARHVTLLARCFPNLKFINLIRDGRDVACSTLRMSWRFRNPVRIIDRWGNDLAAALSDLQALRGSLYINVRYEDLVLRTEATLRGIAEFLELPWDDRPLSEDIFADSVGRYRKDLDSASQDHSVAKWGGLLSEWGYL